MSIYFSSDLHIGHDKEYVYKDRGFDCIEAHDEAIVNNWNSVVTDCDDVYLLGDVIMKDSEHGILFVKRLRGRIHIIMGNHDTRLKCEMYSQCPNVVEIVPAAYLDVEHFHFYLSHYPTLVSHAELKRLRSALINLYGHTHQTTNFYDDGINGPHPYMYHVGVDSHGLKPVSVEEVMEDIRFQKNLYDVLKAKQEAASAANE